MGAVSEPSLGEAVAAKVEEFKALGILDPEMFHPVDVVMLARALHEIDTSGDYEWGERIIAVREAYLDRAKRLRDLGVMVDLGETDLVLVLNPEWSRWSTWVRMCLYRQRIAEEAFRFNTLSPPPPSRRRDDTTVLGARLGRRRSALAMLLPEAVANRVLHHQRRGDWDYEP
jgi:hypothetical protein